MSTYVTDSKLQDEEINLECDFLSRLQVGESALTVACTVEVLVGTDANPTAMLSGVPSISNNIARQLIIGGLPGVIYQVTFAARSSTNAVYLNQLKLAVLTSPNLSP